MAVVVVDRRRGNGVATHGLAAREIGPAGILHQELGEVVSIQAIPNRHVRAVFVEPLFPTAIDRAGCCVGQLVRALVEVLDDLQYARPRTVLKTREPF